MAEKRPRGGARKRISEALRVLEALGLPREQTNERSALTLLALLGLEPGMEWSAASDPLIGITPMMDFFREHYGKTYAPNTRETVRRYTVHQFVQAGLVLANPDCPSRPTNSPKAVYQIEPSALALLRALHCEEWDERLEAYLSVVEPLRHRYARERDMNIFPSLYRRGRQFISRQGARTY